MNLNKKELEMLSNTILHQMYRLNNAYCITPELKKAIKKEVKELQKIHTKICEAM